jgi:hypothetical protein
MLKLGVIRKSGRAINHRSLLKVLLNPFLRRYYKCCIASTFENEKFQRYTLMRTEGGRSIWEELKSSWLYDAEYDTIERTRRII